MLAKHPKAKKVPFQLARLYGSLLVQTRDCAVVFTLQSQRNGQRKLPIKIDLKPASSCSAINARLKFRELHQKLSFFSFNQIGKQVPTFGDALAIAELIEDNKGDYEKINLIYNKVLSAISYEAVVMEVFNAKALSKAPKIAAYEIEEDTYSADLADFALANSIFAALAEGHAAEISARRNAMDNASKNAGEMMGKLQMQFNRMRQSQITNDLVDIVTGANALE